MQKSDRERTHWAKPIGPVAIKFGDLSLPPYNLPPEQAVEIATEINRIAELEAKLEKAHGYETGKREGYQAAFDAVLALQRQNRCIECGGDYIIDVEYVEQLREATDEGS